MGQQQGPGQESIDVMIANLERDRRIGWAKAYEAEEKLAAANLALSEAAKTIEQLQESVKLGKFAGGALDVIAPSLNPWLSGGPGLQTFDEVRVSSTDDSEDNRDAGQREAKRYLELDDQTRRSRDWRARQLHDWYDDPEAKTPLCQTCGCDSWNHKGPAGPCLECACASYVKKA